MSDIFTKEKRSQIMSKIKSVSRLELIARKIAQCEAGCRLIHQPKYIYGKPDYANKSKKIAVFIHGCYWHGCFRHFKLPGTNTVFWAEKIDKNIKRHKHVCRKLRALGWEVLTIWEHDVKAKSFKRENIRNEK